MMSQKDKDKAFVKVCKKFLQTESDLQQRIWLRKMIRKYKRRDQC